MNCNILTNNLELKSVTFDPTNHYFYSNYRVWYPDEVLAIYDWENDHYVKCACGAIVENSPHKIEEHIEKHRNAVCTSCPHRLRSRFYRSQTVCTMSSNRKDITEITEEEKENFCPHKIAICKPMTPYKPKIQEVDADFTSKLPTVFAMTGWKKSSSFGIFQCVGLACLKAYTTHGVISYFMCNGKTLKYDTKHDIVYANNMETIPETQTFYHRGREHSYAEVYEKIKKLYN